MPMLFPDWCSLDPGKDLLASEFEGLRVTGFRFGEHFQGF